MPRYSQRPSFSRIATSTLPKSLRTKRHATSVTATRKPPAIQNQVSTSTSKLSKPDSPLLEPVKLPPEKITCVSTIGSTSDTTDA